MLCWVMLTTGGQIRVPDNPETVRQQVEEALHNDPYRAIEIEGVGSVFPLHVVAVREEP